jgi:hypothetical protein
MAVRTQYRRLERPAVVALLDTLVSLRIALEIELALGLQDLLEPRVITRLHID